MSRRIGSVVDSRGRRAALAGIAAAALPGCVSLVPDAPARQWYVLEDLGSRGRVDGARIPRVILVEPSGTGGFHDSTALPYSRASGVRAHYQFAGWTERPSRRIANLLERRLLERGRFDGVAQATAGVRGDLLLRMALEDAHHDLAVSPGEAVLVLGLELIDWRRHRQVARREVRVRAPVARDDAAAAAAGFSRAVTLALDQACGWVESQAEASLR